MKIAVLAAIVAAPVITLLGAPAASADPTANGIAHNPGLQVNCAFNPAFRKVYASECEGFDVEAVASNGGAPEPEEPTTTP